MQGVKCVENREYNYRAPYGGHANGSAHGSSPLSQPARTLGKDRPEHHYAFGADSAAITGRISMHAPLAMSFNDMTHAYTVVIAASILRIILRPAALQRALTFA